MSVSNNNTSYRRGVLLGLTMAEVVILIIFLLLLAFATLLDRERKANEAQNMLMGSNGQYAERIVYIFASQPPDMAEEMVKAIEAMPEVIKTIEEKQLAKPEETLSMTLVRGIQKIESEKEILEYSDDVPIEQKLISAIEKQKELESETKILTDQKKNLISQIQSKGRGVDWPPCWPDSEGKPDGYIFSIDLTSSGIVMIDATPPQWMDEKNKLPLENIKYGTPRSIPQFQSETRPIFSWSQQKECRFYVLVKDKTAPTEKALFQQQLLAVEGSFYKKLVVKPSESKGKSRQKIERESEDDGKSFFESIFGSSDTVKQGRQGYN